MGRTVRKTSIRRFTLGEAMAVGIIGAIIMVIIGIIIEVVKQIFNFIFHKEE